MWLDIRLPIDLSLASAACLELAGCEAITRLAGTHVSGVNGLELKQALGLFICSRPFVMEQDIGLYKNTISGCFFLLALMTMLA